MDEERLEQDRKLLERIEYLLRLHRTAEQDDELEKLYHQYYVTNDDIRRYWKTY